MCWQVVCKWGLTTHAHTPPTGRRQMRNCCVRLGRPNVRQIYRYVSQQLHTARFQQAPCPWRPARRWALWRSLNIAANRNKGREDLRRGGHKRRGEEISDDQEREEKTARTIKCGKEEAGKWWKGKKCDSHSRFCSKDIFLTKLNQLHSKKGRFEIKTVIQR